MPCRKDLNPSLYSPIDSFLKLLKSTCRRLQVVSTILANEEQLLDRIYYKGKNQHRSALFWRRTAELRRYSERVRKFTLTDTVTRLRSSFFKEDSSAQNLRGAWTHFPDSRSLETVLERSRQAQALLTKFREKLEHAHNSFSTSMQSGAFIQVLLVLAAISARMNSIVVEYEDILNPFLHSISGLKLEIEKSTLTLSVGQPSGGDIQGHHDMLQTQRDARATHPQTPSAKAEEEDIIKPGSVRKPKRLAKNTKQFRKKRDEIDDIFGF